MLKIVAFSEIAGGLFGIFYFIWFWIKYSPTLAYHILYGIGLCIFIFCIYTGVQLWKLRPRGIFYSILIQCLQISKIYLGTIAYEFVVGLSLSLGRFKIPFGAKNFGFGPVLSINAVLNFFGNNPNKSSFIEINFFPVIYLILLFIGKRRLQKKTQDPPDDTMITSSMQSTDSGKADRVTT